MKYKYFAIPVLIIIAGFVIYQNFFNRGTAASVTPSEFAELSKASDAVVLDVRSAFEFRGDKISGARNVSFSKNFNETVKELDKGKTYLVYCATGSRSRSAAALMKDMGFKNVHELSGGIERWKSEGMPVVR